LKQNCELIGRCGIITNDLESEIHIVLAKPYWGQGYGLEVAIALMELSLQEFPNKKIVAKVHPDNAFSIKILKRIGMIQTGIISSVGYDNGFLRFDKTNL
jgi:ribosomal-protein-alanine N-acetyltransferase